MKQVLLGIVAAASIALPANAVAQVADIQFAERPSMIKCDERPCFRLMLNVSDAAGQPVAFPSGTPAVQDFTVLMDGAPVTLFYVGSEESAAAQATRRSIMVLVDVSGSMNRVLPGSRETRFAAAQRAVQTWMADFKEGLDAVAVVPFESHDVDARVDDAVFATTARALDREISRLPVPKATNNTALYSAICEGLAQLKQRRERGDGVMLVVLSDGANDVRQGDDRGLLGDEGLAIVKERARQAAIPIFTIGFGMGQADFAERALRDIAWPSESNYRRALSAEDLQAVFSTARARLTKRLQLTVGAVSEAKERLTGHTVRFKVQFKRASGGPLEAEAPAWMSNFGAPNWEGEMTRDEAAAFVSNHPAARVAGMPTILKRLIVLAVYSLLLALLWFGLPRLVWPERYLPRPVIPTGVAPRAGAPAYTVPRPPRPLPPDPRMPAGRAPADPGGQTILDRGRQAPAAPQDPTIYIRPDMRPKPKGPDRGRDNG